MQFSRAQEPVRQCAWAGVGEGQGRTPLQEVEMGSPLAPPALPVRPLVWSPNSSMLTNKLRNKKTKLVRRELIRTC